MWETSGLVLPLTKGELEGVESPQQPPIPDLPQPLLCKEGSSPQQTLRTQSYVRIVGGLHPAPQLLVQFLHLLLARGILVPVLVLVGIAFQVEGLALAAAFLKT